MANLMEAGSRFNLERRQEVMFRHPVKVTALWTLKEALLKEKYEECSEIIAIAKEFGAHPAEIYYLLEDPRRRP